MELQHVNVKIYVEGDLTVDPARFIKVFHEWIQEDALDEMLIDVADYRHVPAGPGVLLIAHEADYSMDNTDNRWGLRYNRKSMLEGDNENRFRQALRSAANACRLLEARLADESVPLKFSRHEFELFINDRALAPNSPETFAACRPELEAFLEWKGDSARLEQIRALSSLASIRSVIQHEQLGLGHAVLTAKALVGDETFAVFLPDDVIDAPTPAIQQLLDVHQRTGGSVLAVLRVPREEISRYGIVGGEECGPRTYRVRRLVEKPQAADAPSNLAIIGRYVLSPKVFEALERAKPGAVGEIQLTDGIDGLLEEEEVYALEFEGELLDAGTPLGLLKASVRTALKRPDLAEEFGSWLREQVARLE